MDDAQEYSVVRLQPSEEEDGVDRQICQSGKVSDWKVRKVKFDTRQMAKGKVCLQAACLHHVTRDHIVYGQIR
jgi:hypothetical protein